MDKERITTESLVENNEALVKKYIDMEDVSLDDDILQQGAPHPVGTGSETGVEEQEVGDEMEEALYETDRTDEGEGGGPPDGLVKQRIGEVSIDRSAPVMQL